MSNPQYPNPQGGGNWGPPPEGGSNWGPPPDQVNNQPPPQPGYGQPPAYGQPNYGQPPPAYGQPPTYGQPTYGQPPAYDQPPMSAPYGQPGVYNAPQPGYGYQPMYGAATGAVAMAKAGFWIRFVAYIIDAILVGIVSGVLGSFLPSTIGSILGFVLFAAYAVGTSIYFNGSTVGKMALGLKVVDESGNLPELSKLIIRYSVGYFISGLILAIGFIMIGFDAQKQGLHDKIANTYVVYKNQPGGMPRY